MTARLRKLIADLGDAFWLIPSLMVLGGLAAAIGLVAVDASQAWSAVLRERTWVYGGGATGARSLLGAIATSSITVAGTVFSITIAALTLAAGQMGPRLLRNFTRDRGNQVTLGAFLGTFVYALMVLRSVRAESEGEFVPHLALTVGIGLAIVCVAALVWYVDHMAGRINVDTVVALVSDDLVRAIEHHALADCPPVAPPFDAWLDAVPIRDERHGYLQQLDAPGIADWAAQHGIQIRMLRRPGDYVFPIAPVAVASSHVEGTAAAISGATALGQHRTSNADLEYAVRQLVEVALRALSPGINDPYTAITVLDHLGVALCRLEALHLPSGVFFRDDRPVLVVPSVDYDGLLDAMLHAIRQNAGGKPAVLIRMLEVLVEVATVERNEQRRRALRRHAGLVLSDAERTVAAPSDLADVRDRFAAVTASLRIESDGGR